MYKMLLGFAMLVAFVAMPQVTQADKPEKAGPPGAEMLFRLLDANHDGVISADEIPADAPAPLKALLKAADKKGDKKVTLDEFLAAASEHLPPMPPFGMPRGPGRMPPPPPFGMPLPGMYGMYGGMMPPCGPGAPGMGFWPPSPLGPPHDGLLGKAPDLKELFEKFDKNKDGKLTLEEFTEGMKQLHKDMLEHAGPWGPMPGCPMPPPPPGHDGIPFGGMGFWMMGGPMPGGHGFGPHPDGGECPMMKPPAGPPPGSNEKGRETPEARIKELEARVKALEARLESE